MKKIIIILSVMICIPSFLFGQESNEIFSASKHEFSIVIDDILARNRSAIIPVYYFTSSSLLPVYYINTVDLITPKVGFGYKLHFSESALRSKVLIGISNNSSDDEDDENKSKDSYMTSNINVGYELHKNMHKTQFFYGADIIVNYANYKYKNTNYGTVPHTVSENNTKTTGIGLAPLLGFKYFLNKSLSVSTELRMSMEYFQGEEVDKSNSTLQNDKTTYSGFDITVGPLGQISINVHL